jgi:hypothetical protein
MTMRAWGVSNDIEFCTTMKRPLACAFLRISSATSYTCSGLPSERMTNCTGKPPPVPGSEGRENTKRLNAGTARHGCLYLLLGLRHWLGAFAPVCQLEAEEATTTAIIADD